MQSLVAARWGTCWRVRWLAFPFAWAAVGILAVLVSSCRSPANSASSPAAAPLPQNAATIAPWDTLAPDRARFVQEVLTTIAGREDSAAGSVFRNVQLPGLQPIRARQFLNIMSQGFARSLGVSCTHCHVPGTWDADDKQAKLIARQMMRMANQLTQQIRAIPGVRPNATVNCTTCHRGAVLPAISLTP